MSTGWWVTTGLGVLGALVVPLATNCVFGSTVCAVLVALSGAINVVLGVTHPGITGTPKI